MSDAPSKLQRWLDVIAYLASRRTPVATEELWANVPAYASGSDGSEKQKQTVRRMFERDKDELRSLGIPIETVAFTINYGHEQLSGYRLQRKDFHLPYLKLLEQADGERGALSGGPLRSARSAAGDFELTEQEAAAALDGLRDLASLPGFPLAGAARSAFRKLAFDMEPGVARESHVVYAHDPETLATADWLPLLSGAVQRRKTVACRYRSMTSDTNEVRELNPYGLLFQHGRWYLIALDVAREGVRMFRTGRMTEVSVNTRSPGTPDFDVPADFSLDGYTGRKAWELGADEQGPTEATVRFRFPRSLWADRNGHGELVAEESDGSQTRRFSVHRVDPFLRWVLSLAGDARVEEPPDLRDAFATLAGSVADVHAGFGAETTRANDRGGGNDRGAGGNERGGGDV